MHTHTDDSVSSVIDENAIRLTDTFRVDSVYSTSKDWCV